MTEQNLELLMAKIQVAASGLQAAAENDDSAAGLEPMQDLLDLCGQYLEIPGTNVEQLTKAIYDIEPFEVMVQLERFIPAYPEEKARIINEDGEDAPELKATNIALQLLTALTKAYFDERTKFYDAFMEANGIAPSSEDDSQA